MADFSIEDSIITTFKNSAYILGVDEVGCGALAGPVVAAAVCFMQNHKLTNAISEIDDSKKLTYKKREFLFDVIINTSVYSIGFASPNEIDQLNILQATHLAILRSLQEINIPIDYVLLDGNRIPKLPWKTKAIIKGDNISTSIAAASIIAKVTRDRYMEKIHNDYPQYLWQNNKGYGTKKHLDNLIKFGISPHHRLSFSPVYQATQQSLNI